MMKQFDLYGWRTLPLAVAVQRLTDLLGIPFELHESSYVGEYYLSRGEVAEKLTVQSNFEDEEGYLIEPDFQGYRTLVYVTAPTEAAMDQLYGLRDLHLLRSELL